jgi:hypothetical protein
LKEIPTPIRDRFFSADNVDGLLDHKNSRTNSFTTSIIKEEIVDSFESFNFSGDVTAKPFFPTSKTNLSHQNFELPPNRQIQDKFNPFAFKNNRRMLTKDYKIKKKTELCSSFMQTGSCKYAENCAFAHGESELKKKVHVPSMYKTKLC